MVKISPSIISCRLETMKEQIEECERGGASSFHLDIMDGHFVPNLTMGQDMIRAIRRCTNLELEAHMMLTNPEKYWDSFQSAGADTLLFHYESFIDARKLHVEVEKKGKKFGIVINPDTSVEKIFDLLHICSTVLVMSVYPGFSGQKFIESSLKKVEILRKYIDQNGLKTQIEIDGGINDKTGKMAVNAGADILVSASFIFNGNIQENIAKLKC
ncbi:ribulose-phosphate 3-epimerase [Caldiplasma sukawensis]